MVEDFPSNSHGSTPPGAAPKRATETRKIERVTQGEVIRRKKPLGKRLKELFISGPDAKSVLSYVTGNVLIPAAKDMVADAGRETIERMIFGEVQHRRGSSWRGAARVPYDQYSRGRSTSSPPWQADPRTRDVSSQARANHSFDEILLESRGEAEHVIDQLIEIISQYGQSSVADLYAMVGISSAYTDGKYGWTSLQGANVSHVRGGAYLLNLPKPVPLD